MTNISHSSNLFNHFSLAERKLLEKLLRNNIPVSKIASLLGKHRSSIYRQISNKNNLDFVKIGKKVYHTYSAQKAEKNYRLNKSNCGAKYKLFKDNHLISYIEDSVINKKWSPDVSINRAKLNGWNFKINISARSIYNYIDRQQINITPFDLRFKLRRKKPKKQQLKENKKKLGKSIELRPNFINDRTQFGHWEGDTIQDKDCNSVFVLTERVSRFGLMIKLARHTSEEVLKKLRALKRNFGKIFKKVFKSITFDNGSEFYKTVDFDKGLDVYFTHPYCSYEKGGVENYNGIIRRYIPKGKDIKSITRQKIQAINKQINDTPRKILNYRTPNETFEKYLQSL